MDQRGERALVSKKDILFYRKGEVQREKQEIIAEVPLTIFFNGKELVTLLCSPIDMEALAVGFLRSEGLITAREDLRSVDRDKEKGIIYVEALVEKELELVLRRKRTITSGCGGGTTLYRASDLLHLGKIEKNTTLQPQWVISFLKELQIRSDLYRRTRGIHASFFTFKRRIILYAEDIGRHNAVDKLIGKLFLDKDIQEVDSLVSSGRISSEILLKAARVKIPVVISRAAPTSLSVELAEDLGITIISFVQGQNFKVFSHPHRVIQSLR